MPKLVIMNNGEPQEEKALENENTTIGRAPDCDIILDDALVSRHHLRIISILGDSFLEDLNSANGTLVNDRLTMKCPLEDGDIITVGNSVFVYNSTQRDETSEEEFDRTRVQLIKQLSEPDEANQEAETPIAFTGDVDMQDTTVITRQNPQISEETAQEINSTEEQNEEISQDSAQSRTKAENPKERVGNLTILSGKRQGHNMTLTKSVTSIDKSGQRVAAVTKRPDGYFLVPLGDGSQDDIKVIINGEEINRRIFPLWSNDVIELGGTEMEFAFSD
jgi:pSer/pThr/pTyr-binding forkhead associated (FHA) protein